MDVPSGISAATGARLGVAFRADVTPTFIGLKQGLFTGAAPDYTGEVVFDDLDVPGEVFEGLEPAARRVDAEVVADWLPPREGGRSQGRLRPRPGDRWGSWLRRGGTPRRRGGGAQRCRAGQRRDP
ncbi:MAG: hypothetical protein U5L11_11175 [Arhodomonas sp.]|nr:hypothetical protein [Arhodomonas sp.]